MEAFVSGGAGGVGAAAVVGVFVAAAVVGGFVAAVALVERAGVIAPRKRPNAPPAVPGLPIIGNLHQLKEKKPHQTFTKWAEIYGPIYTIRIGASSVVVLNSTEVAKEAMVAKFSSISTRKLSKALTVLTRDKSMVATSDYGDFHKMVKRYVMSSTLGTSAQKKFRDTRDMMINNMLSTFHKLVKDDPHVPLIFRDVFKDELFRLSMIQSLGEDVSSVYVDEIGRDISKEEIYNATVTDMMMCAIEVDWRDFFSYLSWVPNKSFETRVFTAEARRTAVMRALIKQQKERIVRGEAKICYLDFLLAENTLTDEQLTMLVWEELIEAADTTLVATEWAMYELAKNPDKQARNICYSDPAHSWHYQPKRFLLGVFLVMPGTALPRDPGGVRRRGGHRGAPAAAAVPQRRLPGDAAPPLPCPAHTPEVRPRGHQACRLRRPRRHRDGDQPVRVQHEQGVGVAGGVGAREVHRREVGGGRHVQDDGVRRREEGLRREPTGDAHRVHRHRALRAGVRVEADGGRRGEGGHRAVHRLQAPPASCPPHAQRKDMNHYIHWKLFFDR
ncbi:ent-kaurene oxidase-like protein 1 isoform X1 [Oryza glaberrima]|uniref:ent-kaurene oxidase-like protein 1 isoform X1 n=1 Tax=Oryza glaberrima TaxID=4538 RepID=UPI00224C3FF9|nr:ent-kaurene oxidase-like protein 1 isoform X1 [Oryza glaberrima]